MSKVALSRAKQAETGLNFVEGMGEIVEIESVVHQFPVATKGARAGFQSEPGTMVRMMLQRLDADFKHTQDDPVEEYFGCGKLEKIHPGIADGPEDQDPEDRGTAIGAAGNTLWSDGSAINTKSKWAVFCASLEKAGFKPQVLDACFLPDFVGLKAKFVSVDEKNQDGSVYKILTVKEVIKYPYDQKGGAGSKKGAAAKDTDKGSTNGKASPEATQAAAAVGDEELEAGAVRILLYLASSNKASTLPKEKVAGKLVTVLNGGVPDEDGKRVPFPPKQHKGIQGLFKNAAWMAEKCGDLGYSYDDGALSFPAGD